MKEKAIISTATLAASLAFYFYAKSVQKDVAPYVMIGGFIGAIVGEGIADYVNRKKQK